MDQPLGKGDACPKQRPHPGQGRRENRRADSFVDDWANHLSVGRSFYICSIPKSLSSSVSSGTTPLCERCRRPTRRANTSVFKRLFLALWAKGPAWSLWGTFSRPYGAGDAAKPKRWHHLRGEVFCVTSRLNTPRLPRCSAAIRPSGTSRKTIFKSFARETRPPPKSSTAFAPSLECLGASRSCWGNVKGPSAAMV